MTGGGTKETSLPPTGYIRAIGRIAVADAETAIFCPEASQLKVHYGLSALQHFPAPFESLDTQISLLARAFFVANACTEFLAEVDH